MACYHPLMLYDTGEINAETGKRVMNFLGSVKSMLDIDNSDRDNLYYVPCNRCIGCRLDYAREWSNRMLLELADNPNALFVTLTYDNDHVPFSDLGFMSTSVRDCQLFFKRLRKAFQNKKIRYFLGAEYGPKTNRPHYHAIIFGLTFSDFPDLKLLKYNNLGQPLFSSDQLAMKIWKNGFCTIGAVTKESCGYTARYMLKKLKGFDRTFFYDKRHIEPEFSLCSRRPGIGLGYFENGHSISNNISVFDGEKTVTFPIPKKLFDKILNYDEDLYYVLKATRKESASSSEYLEYLKSDLDYLEYLGLKESLAYSKIKAISAKNRLNL